MTWELIKNGLAYDLKEGGDFLFCMDAKDIAELMQLLSETDEGQKFMNEWAGGPIQV